MLRSIIPYKYTNANNVFSFFHSAGVIIHLLFFICSIQSPLYQSPLPLPTDTAKRLSVCLKKQTESLYLQEDTDHSTATLIDDFFQRLLHFKLCIARHMHQLIG